jgi:hypothetical protein
MAGMPYLLLGGMGFWFYRSIKSSQKKAQDGASDPTDSGPPFR